MLRHLRKQHAGFWEALEAEIAASSSPVATPASVEEGEQGGEEEVLLVSQMRWRK